MNSPCFPINKVWLQKPSILKPITAIVMKQNNSFGKILFIQRVLPANHPAKKGKTKKLYLFWFTLSGHHSWKNYLVSTFGLYQKHKNKVNKTEQVFYLALEVFENGFRRWVHESRLLEKGQKIEQKLNFWVYIIY